MLMKFEGIMSLSALTEDISMTTIHLWCQTLAGLLRKCLTCTFVALLVYFCWSLILHCFFLGLLHAKWKANSELMPVLITMVDKELSGIL